MMELESQQSIVRGKKPPPTTTRWVSSVDVGFPNKAAVGAPLFELNAVDISGPLLHHICAGPGPVQIHGHIALIDDLGNQFSLFTRNQSDPLLTNPLYSSCYITRDKLEGPRCLPSVFWLDFQLILKGDKEEDAVGFFEYLFIDCTGNVDYDKLQQSSVGIFGLQIRVHYTIFRCALLARAGIVVEKTDANADSDILYGDLSGSIDVCYPTSHCSWMTQRVYSGERQKLKLGDFIEGPTFAAPAYSTLYFPLDLHINGEPFSCDHDTLKFYAHDIEGIPFERQIRGQNYMIRLIVSVGIAIIKLPESKIREWCDVDPVSRLTKVMKNPYNKRPRRSRRQRNFLLNDQPIYIQPHLQSLNNRDWIVTDVGQELVEIFSISVCSLNMESGSLSLKGAISGYDNDKELDLFKGGVLDVVDDDIVKLADFGCCFKGWYFGIHVNLEDDDGREISNGYAAYSQNSINYGWFNRRICSVIRGTYGYAALHYSIFQEAVEAKLKFKLVSKLSSTRGRYEVCGKISTRYNNLRYATHYEKKYYESRLFEKRDSEAVMLEEDEIPLLKSAVAVPSNASLIVLGNINVMVKGKHLDSFQFEEIFPSEKPDLVDMTVSKAQKLNGSKFSLLVHVEWGYELSHRGSKY